MLRAELAGRGSDRLLQGKTLLLTAGPTREPIDPVRYITNRSSGKMGYAIAEAAAETVGHLACVDAQVGEHDHAVEPQVRGLVYQLVVIAILRGHHGLCGFFAYLLKHSIQSPGIQAGDIRRIGLSLFTLLKHFSQLHEYIGHGIRRIVHYRRLSVDIPGVLDDAINLNPAVTLEPAIETAFTPCMTGDATLLFHF